MLCGLGGTAAEPGHRLSTDAEELDGRAAGGAGPVGCVLAAMAGSGHQVHGAARDGLRLAAAPVRWSSRPRGQRGLATRSWARVLSPVCGATQSPIAVPTTAPCINPRM